MKRRDCCPFRETTSTNHSCCQQKGSGVVNWSSQLGSKRFREDLGQLCVCTHTSRVVQNLRKSKERVAQEFPFVANFYVDNNATIFLLKGKEALLDENLMIALIKWIYLFMNSSNQIQSLDIRDLTAKISPSLEEIEFYSIYQKVAALKAQDSWSC